jgi:threonylcarbamoyladenosine tRNA methylthiotransferase MtaB
MRTVKFYTLGCKANQYDTQLIRESFIRQGFKELDDAKPANTCVINTCTVTHRADADSFNLIRKAKRENPKARIIVTGCLAELDGEEIAKIPGVSQIIKKGALLEEGRDKGITYFKGHTRAFLKIQDGCNNSCSYCKVPRVRGSSRSKPLNKIIAEATRLIENGFKELVLSGICLGAYGRDLRPKLSLVNALEALENLNGLLRLRLSSIEAGDISDGLIDKMAQSQRICPHLHIPFQSGDNEILKRMNRGYTFQDYSRLTRRIKARIPEIAITTDIMVGFPGEREGHFQNTIKLIRKIAPLKVHIFPYSSRNGTAAGNLKNRLNPAIVKERALRLKEISRDCSIDYKKRFLNKKMDVLIEERVKENRGYWEGYTGNYIKVRVKSGPNLKNRLILLQLNKIGEDYIIASPV